MFCPNCGAKNSTEQKFCRACGLNLEKHAELFLAQFPNAQTTIFQKQTQLTERFGIFALTGLGIVIVTAVIALIVAVFSKMIANGANVAFGILLIAFLVFALLSLIFVFFNESLKEKKAKINHSAAPLEINEARETGKLLEENFFEPVSSVAENSTELLFVENKIKRIK